jgi:hypothetical protein
MADDGSNAADLRPLHDRLDRIEVQLQALTAALSALAPVASLATPGFAALVDTFDRAAAGRPDTDARARELVAGLELLSRPGRAASLDAALGLAERVPGVLAMCVDALDQAGPDTDLRVRSLARLAERLTRPATADAVDAALDAAERAPGFVAMFVDALDSRAQEAAVSTWSPDERLHAVWEVLDRASRPDTARRIVHALDGLVVLDELLESGVLDRGAVRTVGQVGLALRETASAPVEPVGLWGALRATTLVETRRALGFLIGFARNFGARLLR